MDVNEESKFVKMQKMGGGVGRGRVVGSQGGCEDVNEEVKLLWKKIEGWGSFQERGGQG